MAILEEMLVDRGTAQRNQPRQLPVQLMKTKQLSSPSKTQKPKGDSAGSTEKSGTEDGCWGSSGSAKILTLWIGIALIMIKTNQLRSQRTNLVVLGMAAAIPGKIMGILEEMLPTGNDLWGENSSIVPDATLRMLRATRKLKKC